MRFRLNQKLILFAKINHFVVRRNVGVLNFIRRGFVKFGYFFSVRVADKKRLFLVEDKMAIVFEPNPNQKFERSLS